MKNYSLKALLKDDFHKTLTIEDRLSLALQSAGFKPAVLPGFSDDFIIWQNTKTGENAVMDGWYGVQDYLEEHINTLGLSDLQKEKINFLIDDKYIHNPHTLNNPLKMVDVIAHYEIDNNVPENDRLTNWFGDNSMYEPKLGVTGSQVKAKYMELKYPDTTIEKEVAPDAGAAALSEDNYSRSPRRYNNKNGESERLWNGKLIDNLTEEERMQFLIETDLQLNKELSENAKNLLFQNGYGYEDNKLTKISLYRELSDVVRNVESYDPSDVLRKGDIAYVNNKHILIAEDQVIIRDPDIPFPEVELLYGLDGDETISFLQSDIQKILRNDIEVFNNEKAVANDPIDDKSNLSSELPPESKNYAAAENTQKEKLEQLNNQIKDLVESYKTNPDHIAELLAFKESFYKYSLNNTMLVYDQNPNATFVQSYDAWKRDGYNVLKGQKGLKVLVPTKVTYLKVPGTDKLVQLSHAPDSLKAMYKAHNIESIQKQFFKVGNVFDISQTDVPKENYPEYYSMGYKNSDYDNVIAGISKYSQEKLNCPVTIKDLQSIALRGCYFPIDNTIELNNLLESSEKISTLTHELGHAVLHNDPDLKISASKIEFEADCMSIMLESHFGIPLADARKEHISTHYKKLASELSTEDIAVDFKGILNDVFSKYESMIEDIDHYVSEEISKSQELNTILTSEDIESSIKDTEQLQMIDDYVPSGSLVNRMLETENNVNLEGLEYALEA